jgi:sterol desaturase/sphingolipid hydroxylase (fatty acid hydroxylase superfamily)
MTINEAMQKSETIRMFENPLFERLSHVHPAPRKNFGFTSPFWDYIGGSYFGSTAEDRNIDDHSGLKPL